MLFIDYIDGFPFYLQCSEYLISNGCSMIGRIHFRWVSNDKNDCFSMIRMIDVQLLSYDQNDLFSIRVQWLECLSCNSFSKIGSIAFPLNCNDWNSCFPTGCQWLDISMFIWFSVSRLKCLPIDFQWLGCWISNRSPMIRMIAFRWWYWLNFKWFAMIRLIDFQWLEWLISKASND